MAALRVPVVLREAPRGALWGPEVLAMSGLEMLRASVDRRVPDPPLTHLTGLRLTEAGLGVASAAMPASPWWQSGAGVFLAGTIAFVADLPLGAAVLSGAAAGVGVASSQLSVSFVRPVTIRSQALTARARLIHSTTSLGLAEATIDDGRGRLVGHATSRAVLVPARKGAPAAAPPSRLAPAPATLADPYLRTVEGDVLGQDFWDATPGMGVVRKLLDPEFAAPVLLLLGMRMTEGTEGQVTFSMPASPWLANAFGVIYGGALALLADTAMTLATGSTVAAGTAYSPLDMHVHFLRPVVPVEGQELLARARVFHRGRTIAVVGCEIVDGEQRVVAQASGSVLILPGRPWERPVSVADEFTQDIDRVLATVLFVDIVGSTARAAELGDRRWTELLAEFQAAARERIQRARGTELDTAGDGFLVSFDGAARAIRCAASIREAARGLGLEVRAGIHTGEAEQSGGKLVGMAVHIGARIASLAGPGEVLVSATVRDLAGGSGIEFEDRGSHALKGVPGEWRIFAARV